MSDPELEPLPDAVARLLAEERARPKMPSAMRDKLLENVRTAVSLPPDSSAAAEPSSASSSATENPASAPSATAASPLGPGPATLLPGAGMLKAMAIFVAGGLTGAGVQSYIAADTAPVPAPIPAVVSDEMPNPPVIEAPPPTTPAPPPLVPAPAESRPEPSPPARALPTDRDGDLATERALLERARTAMSRGEGALEALDEHARRFPKGQLVQEREALAIRALVQAGRGPEARARAEAFRREHPGSLLGPAVEAALRALDER